MPAPTQKLIHFVPPMLAKETASAFNSKDWLFEIKWDGYRAIAELDAGNVKLYSRNGNSFNESYPLVVQELNRLRFNAILDGEIIVLDENGKPDFQLLQYYKTNTHSPIQYQVFDILKLEKKDLTTLPLLERKKILKSLLPKNDVIRFSDHIETHGIDFFELAKEQDLEGIIAKRADSNYYPGKRTGEWLKIKYHKSHEAIVAGFTAPTGSRKYFGALILAIREDGHLKYIGHTGSGFTEKSLKEIYDKLKPLIQTKSPFLGEIKTNMPATWVKPELVCEMKFSEWTNDGKMRHPIFLHLRNDKKASEVTMEDIKPIKPPEVKKQKKSNKLISNDTQDNNNNNDKEYKFGRIKVNTTHLTKLFFPKAKITKGDIINYYISIADIILPYLKDRPQSLKRNPNGIIDEGFFQKDAGRKAPDWVKSKKIYSESADKEIDYILCNNKATLTYLNNLGCIEINPWHSTIKTPDKPDYLIIDIDPSSKNTFDEVIEAALVVNDILEKIKAPNFCKTSGATGMHVYIPMGKKYTYDQAKQFAELLCHLAQQQLPDTTSTERSLKKRGDKIYMDHLQNRRGQTIACAYSVRPFEGAPVSTPLSWKEVKPGIDPKEYNIYNTLQRIHKKGDLFKGILGKGIDLSNCLKALEK